MTVITLQASLLCKPTLSFPCYYSYPRCRSSLPPSSYYPSSPRLRLRPRCTLQPLNADSTPSPEPQLDTHQQPLLKSEEAAEDNGVHRDGAETVANSAAPAAAKAPFVLFLLGFWATVQRGFQKLASSDWLTFWPFSRPEKRLERLIAEADANPKDPHKQTMLLTELNKHSPESVIKRFEQRDHAVDSKGVAEYLRALVVTNSIAEYLPDEQSGKPSSLPALVNNTFEQMLCNL